MSTSINHIDYFVGDRFIKKYNTFGLIKDVIHFYNHSEDRSANRKRLFDSVKSAVFADVEIQK
jgi:hypothetical protein